jgi:hypothetical protein
MFNLFKRHSISFLNKSWEPIISKNRKVKYIPREGELIFIEETNRYYRVLNVIYYLNSNQGVFIIIEEFGDQINKS